MMLPIGKAEDNFIFQENTNRKYITSDFSYSSAKQCMPKMQQLQSDVLQIRYAQKSLAEDKSNHLFDLEQKILKANSQEDFTILGVEISKCTNAEKSELIPKYVTKYSEFKEKLYKNKTILPQNIFNDIFRKNLTKEEADLLCSKYKSIIEEPNLEDYAEKLYAQIREDLELDYLPIELEIKELENIGLGVHGGTSSCMDFMQLTYYKDNPLSRLGIFAILMHELNHAKQNEIAIATDSDAYIKATAMNARKKPENASYSLEAMEYFIKNEIGRKTIANIKNKNRDVEKGSPLYKQGMTYINNVQNYIEMQEFDAELFKKYKQQPLEKESYDVQYKAEELYYYLTQAE